MPRCNNFGKWTSVEGLLPGDNEDRGHVLIREEDAITVVGSFPTYEEALEFVREKFKEESYSD